MKKIDADLIRQLRLEQKTIREIASQTGCAMSTVERYLGLFGLTHNQGNWKRKTHREDDSTIARWKLAMEF